MNESPAPTVWPCINYSDAPAAIRFLVDVVGFTELADHRDDTDSEVVVHAELAWPEGGGVMFGSAGRTDSPFSAKPTGAASVYVVTDAPVPILERALAAGATVVKGMEEEDYGSVGFSLADAEGNIWSFGTYRGGV